MFVVTLPASAGNNPKAFALKAKKAGADILEIRGDLTPTVKAFKSPLPLIVSPRGKGMDLIDRLKPEYVDLDTAEIADTAPRKGCSISEKLELKSFAGERPFPGAEKKKLIISYHNYDRTPSLADLMKIVQKICTATGARCPSYGSKNSSGQSVFSAAGTSCPGSKPWAIKIATKITGYEDLLIHRDLQDWMNSFCRTAKFCGSTKQIILGMGDKAHYSRITSPMRNALTYTFLDGTDAAAPGQLPLSFYKILNQQGRILPAMESTSNVRIFGIIGGDQVTHSLSPLIHNLLFQQHGVDGIYSCFPTDDFKGTMKILEKLGIAGLSVTAPFKHDAFRYANMKDSIAKSLGSANTLIYSLLPSLTPSPSSDGRGEVQTVKQSPFPHRRKGLGMREWKAWNTDVIGVERGYPFLKSAGSIAILGAGGVVPAVIEGIRRINPKALITVFARDPKKAAMELEESGVSIQPMSKVIQCVADVVICAVSQDIALPLPKHAKKSVAIDLRYGKETMFMASAAAKGFRVYDGLPMLIHQALAQFELFTGIAAESIPLPILHKMLIH